MTFKTQSHARFLAFISTICLAMAAPYLIPEIPDSPVMRAGIFSALLILFSGQVLTPAFRTFSLRQMTRAFLLAFCFALALSIGTELNVYSQLLPGKGSMLRRILVPLLATPFLGACCMRLTQCRISAESTRPARYERPFAFFFLLICWLPVLLAYWPGMLNYDFEAEFNQHLTGSYSQIHPLLRSAFMNAVIRIGEFLGSRSLGILLLSLFQMITLAAVLSDLCLYLRNHNVPRTAVFLLLCYFGLHPIFSVMAVSMTKDTLFTTCTAGMILHSIRLLEDTDKYLSKKKNWLVFILLSIGCAGMRNNGLFVFIPVLLILFLKLPKTRRHLAFLSAAFLTPLVCHFLLLILLHPVSMPSFQLYSIPAQQLVRAYNTGNLTEEEKSELESWYVSPEGLRLHPHLADPAKGYLDRDRLETEGRSFLALWANAFPRNIKPYMEAFLMLNVGSWYPDDRSHTTIYPDVSYNIKGYLQTQELDLEDWGFENTSYLPKLKAVYEQICRYNSYLKWPVALFFTTGIPIWILLLSLFLARYRSMGQVSLAPMTGAICLFASYLFGPCTLARYMFPLFILAPFSLFLVLAESPKPVPDSVQNTDSSAEKNISDHDLSDQRCSHNSAF